MVRLFFRMLISLAASAIGLIVAAAVLDGMTISGTAFIVAVVIFTVTAALMNPFLQKMALKNSQALLGATSLLSTLVALIVTHLVSSGLSISGFDTWVFASLIVWLVSLAASILLPLLLVKAGVQSLRDNR